MPVGTPLISVAEGTLVLAGNEPPLSCPPLGRTVSGLVIVIRIRPNATDVIDAIYGHVSRIDVELGDGVHIGDVIGASGNTGCALEPHLHFSAARVLGARGEVMIDPYGWSGSGADPWAVDPRGARECVALASRRGTASIPMTDNVRIAALAAS